MLGFILLVLQPVPLDQCMFDRLQTYFNVLVTSRDLNEPLRASESLSEGLIFKIFLGEHAHSST